MLYNYKSNRREMMRNCFGYLRRDTILIFLIAAAAISDKAIEIFNGIELYIDSRNIYNTEKLNE